MTENEFTMVIDRIQAVWPAFKCEERTVKEWYKQIGRYKYTDVDDSITFLSKEEKFPPALSAIFGALTKLNRKDRSYVTQNFEERAEIAKEQRKAGRVLVRFEDGVSGWEEEFRTVWDKKLGCRRRKIDFVCDHVGGAAVEKEIRSITGAKTLSELVSKPGWVTQYLDKLNEMVKTVTDLGF